MTTERLFVLTGAPGAGKTAILGPLASELDVVAEPARSVLAEERARGGTGTPDRDPAKFVHLLLERSIQSHRRAARSGRITLFDRGVPDCIAYAVMLNVDPGPSVDAARTYRYHSDVLIVEPWEEIYATDDERRMSFADTIPFHEAIVEGYRMSGYSLSRVAFDSVAARAAFVRGFVEARVTPGA